MAKRHYRKENISLWYFIVILCIALANYFAWQVLPMIAITTGKIIHLKKELALATIYLNNTGIKFLNDSENPLFFTNTPILVL